MKKYWFNFKKTKGYLVVPWGLCLWMLSGHWGFGIIIAFYLFAVFASMKGWTGFR